MNPLLMIVYSAFIAVLERGSNRIQTTMGIPKSAADMLIGIILFFMVPVNQGMNRVGVFRRGYEYADTHRFGALRRIIRRAGRRKRKHQQAKQTRADRAKQGGWQR